jgi:hypothetical protein
MTADRILGEFIDAWNAGRRPDVGAYLSRAAPGDRDALARELTTWLEVAPTPAYDRATLRQITQEPALARALQAATAARLPVVEQLPALRKRAGLAVADLGQRIADAFDLSDAARTTRYLERLEAGEIDPRGLSRRLLDALGGILRADLSLAGLSAGQALGTATAGGGALWRADDDADRTLEADLELLTRAALSREPPPLDEVDRLFLGGPDA